MKGSTNGAYIAPIDDLNFRSGFSFSTYLYYTTLWKFNITINNNNNTLYFVISTETAEGMMNELNIVLTQLGQDPIADIMDIPMVLTQITQSPDFAAFWSTYGTDLTQSLFIGVMGEGTMQVRYIDYSVNGAVNLPVGINAQGIIIYGDGTNTQTDTLAWSSVATSLSTASFTLRQLYVPKEEG